MARYARKPQVKKSGKKMYRKTYRKNKSFSLSNYPLPTSRVCRLKYFETIKINPGLIPGVVSTFTLSANGIYDPNVSSTGHQPYSFDQLMQFYNKYCVLGSKITIRPAATVTTDQFIWGIKLNDNITPNSTYAQDLIEQPMSKYRIWNGAAATVKDMTIVETFFATKFFRETKSGINARESLQGTSGSNPNEQAYFIIYVVGQTQTPDPSTIDFNVEIEYTALFSGPNVLPSS